MTFKIQEVSLSFILRMADLMNKEPDKVTYS